MSRSAQPFLRAVWPLKGRNRTSSALRQPRHMLEDRVPVVQEATPHGVSAFKFDDPNRTLRSVFEGCESEPETRANSNGCTYQAHRAECPSGCRPCIPPVHIEPRVTGACLCSHSLHRVEKHTQDRIGLLTIHVVPRHVPPSRGRLQDDWIDFDLIGRVRTSIGPLKVTPSVEVRM